MSMERRAISGDVVLHTMLVRICGLKTGDDKLRKFIDDGVQGVNSGNVEATNSEGVGDTSRHNFEVIKADEALVGHVKCKPAGREKVSTENGFHDICHIKHLSENVGLAKQEGYFAFAPCLDKRAIGSNQGR